MQESASAERERTYIPEPSFPVNCFHVKAPDTPIIPPHWHEYGEWNLVRSGRFLVRLDSSSAELGPGSVIFVPPQTVHSAYPIGEGTEILAVVFDETLVRSIALDEAELDGAIPLLRGEIPIPFSFGPDPENAKGKDSDGADAARRIAEHLERIARELAGKKPGYELFVKAALIGTLAELRRASPDLIGAAVKRRVRAEKPIAALLRKMCVEYMDSFSVGEAAAECDLSVGHFCHAFKKATGSTFVDYLRALRLIEADRLIKDTSTPISAIASIVGFEDPAYFGKLYRASRGVSPREARRTSRSGDDANA